MSNGYTVVLDAGTSRAKCFIFDSDGRIVAGRSRKWDVVASDEAYSLEREWEPQATWRHICQLIGDSMGAGEVSSGDIGTVAVTSQRQALAFLDANGNELYVGPSLDLRALFEGAEIDDSDRERVYGVTGHLPSFMFAPAKIRWFQKRRPQVHERIASVMTLGDWLAYRLTGNIFNERSLAGEAGILDIRSRDRCDSLFTDLGVNIDAIPLVDAGSVVGRLGAEAARGTMLREGTAVVTAGPDTQCGLLGMGVSNVGEAGIVAGWSAPVQLITEMPLLSEDGSTWAGCFLTRDKWVAESTAGDVGNAYSWMSSLFYGDAKEGFGEMGVLAGEVSPGSEGTQVILGNARTQFSHPGLRAGGFIFPVPLTLSGLGRGNLTRAALESIAYSIKANVDFLEALAGDKAESIALGGGMIKTQAFAGIMTDVLAREIRLSPTSDASAVGAWLCGATAAGEFATLDEAAHWARDRMRVVEPNRYNSASYQEYYQNWVELSERLDTVNL